MIGLIVFGLIICIGLLLPFNRLYSFIVLIALAILTYVSPNVADAAAYENVYNFIGKSGNEYFSTGYGWWLLCKIGNQLELNYMAFKAVILIISFIFIVFSLRAIKIENNKVIACYLIYPAITDLIQIRFFLATSIVLFLITHFLVKETIKDDLIYVLGILLVTSQIHPATYFYLLLLLWQIFVKYTKLTITFSVIGALILFFDRNLLILLASTFGTEQEVDFYFNGIYYANHSTVLLYGITTLFFTILSIYVFNTVNTDNISNKELALIKLTCFGNYLSMFLIILSSFAFTFFRLQKPMWILNFMILALYDKYGTKGKISPKLLWISFGILTLVWLLSSERVALGDFFS